MSVRTESTMVGIGDRQRPVGAADAPLLKLVPPCLTDGFRRRITYLRVSLTDRCNLRCRYCLPAHGVRWRPRDEILSLEEIVRVASVARELGVRKLRLTGGEPLVREGCVELVSALSRLGFEELCLTSNGLLFGPLAGDLKRAGLDRVNLSLDTLDPARYHAVTRGGDLARVLDAVDQALAWDLRPSLNVVVMRGLNDSELPAFVELAHRRPLTVRFIELMPFGSGETGDCEVRDAEAVTVEEMLAVTGLSLDAAQPAAGPAPGPALFPPLPGAAGRVGFIAAMHDCICASCNRVRLTADGRLKPCLLGDREVPLRDAARRADQTALRAAFEQLMTIKPEHGLRHLRRPEPMAAVGG